MRLFIANARRVDGASRRCLRSRVSVFDELSAVAVMLSAVLMLWWWPVSPRLESRSAPANSDPLAAAEQMLTRLEAELMVASDFDSALESVQWRAYALRPDTQRGLEQAQAVVGEHGASGVPFVAALARRVREQIDLRSRWETAAAAAHSASLMLLILPTALWALAEGLGVHAVSWLIGTTGGWMCIAVGLGLTGIARVVLRLLRRSALEPRASSRVVPISSAAASVSAGIAVLSLRSDAVGMAFGVGLAVIAFLMNYIKTKSFLPFVIYRVCLGLLVMLLLASGVLTA